MSLDRDLDKASKDLRDGIDEAKHRAKAGGEQAKRDIAGDVMTPGEKAKSAINQLGHEAKADVDKIKRDIRDKS